MKLIDNSLIEDLCQKAKQAPRKRTHFNLHESLTDDFHRLCIAAEPGTYMRTHRHSDKWELMIILQGTMGLLVFDDNGKVLERVELKAGGPVFCYEIPENTWHAFTILEENTAMLEVKKGPYVPIPEADSASWAPAEGEENWEQFATWYTSAQPGETLSGK